MDLLKYIASYDDVINICGKDLYLAQKHQAEQSREIIFDPALFLASNKTILEKCYTKRNNKIYKFNGQEYTILRKNKIDKVVEDQLINLFIDSSLINKCFKRDGFKTEEYYAQFFEEINIYFDQEQANVALFYAECGFWNKLEMKPINYLQYIASVPELMCMDNIQAIHYFFQKGVLQKHKLSFNPHLYVASNWPLLKDFIGPNNCVYENRAIKHYISIGYQKGFKYDTFNHWDYLANNIKKIDELCIDNNGKYDYNIINITPSKTAKIFLKYKGLNENTFDPVSFVKMYVDEPDINYDKKLSINNATKYFVKGYTTNNIVRWRTTYRSN